MIPQLCAWCLSTPPRHDRCQPVSRITMVDGRPAIVLEPCMCGCRAEYVGHPEGGSVILYHFTCDHHVASIRREGLVRPNRHPFLPMAAPPISWWTDLPRPNRRAVGLTQTHGRCNRLAHRLQAETDAGLTAWEDWAAAHRIGWAVRLNLAYDPFAQPDHWWVAEEPVAVITELRP